MVRFHRAILKQSTQTCYENKAALLLLTLLTLQTNTDIFANRADPDVMRTVSSGSAVFAIRSLIFDKKRLFATSNASKFKDGRVHVGHLLLKGFK